MSRGGVLLAVALTLVFSPAAAAGQTPQQPDLMFVARGGAAVTGDGTYNSSSTLSGSGAGQQRSVIVDSRTVLVVRLENDGTSQDTFRFFGQVLREGFATRYFSGDNDITNDFKRNGLLVQLAPGASKRFRIVVSVEPSAPLGIVRGIGIFSSSNTDSRLDDFLFLKVTKTSAPG